VNAGLDLAKTTVDRLLVQAESEAPLSILWADDDDVATVIGRTLLWGDHYLIPDPLADALLQRPPVRSRNVEAAVRKMLELRALIELGVVVPVPNDVATILSARGAWEATESDPQRDELVSWVEAQLQVEGPTAREALIIGARDDLMLGGDHLSFTRTSTHPRWTQRPGQRARDGLLSIAPTSTTSHG
jgi:hypothetical protein